MPVLAVGDTASVSAGSLLKDRSPNLEDQAWGWGLQLLLAEAISPSTAGCEKDKLALEWAGDRLGDVILTWAWGLQLYLAR